jgi:hypothetical protein
MLTFVNHVCLRRGHLNNIKGTVDFKNLPSPRGLSTRTLRCTMSCPKLNAAFVRGDRVPQYPLRETLRGQ